MPQRKRKRLKWNPPRGSTRAKGDMVEQIIALMHEESGVQVERNVFLPAKDGSGRTREIDVLLTSSVAGYPIRLAIECKNVRKLVSVTEIGEFIDKLNDVGVPVQHGIYVCVSGFTSDATLRCESVGIKTTILKDLSVQLPKAIQEAFQSLVYLSATITNIQIDGVVPDEISGGLALFFRNKDHKVCAIPDLVWDAWRTGKITDRLGVTKVSLDLPEDWVYFQAGQVPQIKNIVADVQIMAHIITVSAPLTHHVLVDAASQKVDKFNLQAKFERPRGTYQVKTILTESELQAFLNPEKGVNIFVGRFRLPRVRWGPIYWPPSDKALQKFYALAARILQEGKEFDIAKIDLADIEGTDLRALWDPIHKDHPAARNSIT